MVVVSRQFLLMLVVCLFAVSTYADNESFSKWYKHSGSAMGTRITMEFWHESPTVARLLIEGVMAEMNRVDELMSPYIESSELAQMNRHAFQRDVAVSKELYQLIRLALNHGEWSQGTFDITYASVGRQYDYREKIKPSDEEINRSLSFVDFTSVELKPETHSIRFQKSGTKIDLGGIAKGHAVDRAIQYLYENGVRHATVSAGGDSRILGDRRGRPWIMGIKDPRGEGYLISLPLQDVSVSTSGDYERYFIDQSGNRHHHIINPKNGKSASQLRSVTIIGPNATMTDALSTTVFVMGVKRGLSYINGLDDVSAIMIDDQAKLHYSNDLVRPARKE